MMMHGTVNVKIRKIAYLQRLMSHSLAINKNFTVHQNEDAQSVPKCWATDRLYCDYKEFYPGICLTTEAKARINLSQGKKKMSG
jgi:hypothetical protein